MTNPDNNQQFQHIDITQVRKQYNLTHEKSYLEQKKQQQINSQQPTIKSMLTHLKKVTATFLNAEFKNSNTTLVTLTNRYIDQSKQDTKTPLFSIVFHKKYVLYKRKQTKKQKQHIKLNFLTHTVTKKESAPNSIKETDIKKAETLQKISQEISDKIKLYDQKQCEFFAKELD